MENEMKNMGGLYENTVFVNIYLLDLAYGGPEEGGWYFSVGEFIQGQAFSQCDADGIARAKTAAQNYCDEMNDERNSDISSVCSEGRFDVRVESQPGKNWPEHKPFYE